jgi:hypothetical protein
MTETDMLGNRFEFKYYPLGVEALLQPGHVITWMQRCEDFEILEISKNSIGWLVKLKLIKSLYEDTPSYYSSTPKGAVTVTYLNEGYNVGRFDYHLDMIPESEEKDKILVLCKLLS